MSLDGSQHLHPRPVQVLRFWYKLMVVLDIPLQLSGPCKVLLLRNGSFCSYCTTLVGHCKKFKVFLIVTLSEKMR